MSGADDTCRAFLMVVRETLGAPKDDKIDKRYYTRVFGGVECLAPDDLYYRGHCPFCAEVEYLQKKYGAA